MQKDRYEILGPLGFGATSRVDKARDKVIGRTVAIKTLVHSFGAAPQQKQFLREAQIVGQLSHPSIVNLFDVGIEETGIAYLVMEFVDGRTLQQLLAETPVPWPRACAWAADLAAALGRAHHAGIIHGDVKPANILVTEDGRVKLSDFGIARFATQVSGSGRIMGTPAYLAPEQILGEAYSTRSDLFSLGIVLYQMVTGVPPYDGSSLAAVCAQILNAQPVLPTKRNPALPAALDHVILRCLAKDPAERYPSAEALAASLYPLARQVPVAPRGKVSWWSRPLQPRDAWTFAALAVVVGLGFPAERSIASLFHAPPTPAGLTAAAPLAAPQNVADDSDADAEPPAAALSVDARPIPRKPQAEVVRAARPARSPRHSEPAHAIVPATRLARTDGAPASTALPVGIATPVPAAITRASLHIDINTTVSEGTLAIFADHDLLLTTALHAHSADEPMHLQHPVPVGPHQLRVALYRADKSLQTEREGLGEIRTDSLNTLRIRVSRHAKMLVRHQTALDVIWPSITSEDPEANPAGFSASLK